MRILLVSEDIPYPSMGGLAKHVLTLARALIRLGPQADVLGGARHPLANAGAEGHFDGHFYGELDGHQRGWKEQALGVYLLPRRSWLARHFAAIIMRHAGRYDVVHYHGHVPNLARHIPASVNFIQTRHDQGSDCVLHTRFRDGAVCTSTDPADCARCHNPHANALQVALSSVAVKRYRQEVRQAFARHKTVFVSDMLRRNLARSAGEKNTGGRGKGENSWGVTVHNFVDRQALAEARAQRNPGAGADGMVRIFIAAKIYPAKGIEPFLELLAPVIPDAMRVEIAGDGQDLERLQQLYGGARIRFLGWRDMPEILSLAAAAHALVVPSVWEEPCGTTILESLLLGKTTFALARGGTPELAVYASAPEQLRLFGDMASLVHDLIAFVPVPDYPPPPDGAGDVSHAAKRLLQLYRLPPGPLHP